MIKDNRTIITLDGNVKGFTFRAIRDGKNLTRPIVYSPYTNDLDQCLQTIVDGFSETMEALPLDLIPDTPSALSLGFPGPADYKHGVIGNLPNFPAFKDGVALGAFLEKRFGLPVFIENDGNLYAYGEAVAGSLPELNEALQQGGSQKKYQNVIGLDLGAGLGYGMVSKNTIITGDNNNASGLWRLSDFANEDHILEEYLSERGIIRSFKQYTGRQDEEISIENISKILEEETEEKQAAEKAFKDFGLHLGKLITYIANILDGAIVLGGNLVEFANYFMPTVEEFISSQILMKNDLPIKRTTSNIIYVKDKQALSQLMKSPYKMIQIPHSEEMVTYEFDHKLPLIVSNFDTSLLVSLGAYYHALEILDQRTENTYLDI